MSDKKPTTRDQIDVLLETGSSGEPITLEYKDLIEKLNDLHGQNAHKVYDSFHATLVKDDKLGLALLFEGEREESKEETTAREAQEKATRKRIEDAELKEYLRLRGKYGKKKK